MSLKGTVWAPIGPSPMSEGGTQDNGLVTAIAVNPNNNNVLYLGTAQGGVWHSGDGGSTWTPLFDQQPALGIGEPGGIAIDPSNTSIIYVGTGGIGSFEPNTIGQPTAGLFKSTDSGASWIALGSGYPAGNTGNASQFVNQAINVIIVDPSNGVLYLSAASGVFTSSDSGLNWTAAGGIAGNSRSLALDFSTPASARILYAGVDGNGVFRSTNGGRTFTRVLSATTPAVATALGASGSFNRVVVALAPPTSPPNVNGVQVIYVTLSGPYGGSPDPVGLFISTDQGATWTQQAATGMGGTTYGGYALDMAVDPASPGDGVNDVIYYGTLAQFKSINSGVTFTGLGVGHADTHTWTLVPQLGGASSVVYCGTDGGIDVSTNAGATWTPLNGGGLQTGLFYNIDIKPDATASVTVGALQDNQVQTTAPPASGLGWIATVGGDGWDVAYDGSGSPVLYATSGGPATSVTGSNDDGVTWPINVTPPWTPADTGGFLLTQLAADPSASGIIYVSGNQNLWQLPPSAIWRKIATPGTSGNVDVAPTNGNNVVIAAGSQVYVSTNALAATVGPPTGVTFTNITRNLPFRNVTRAVFDPVDPDTIYAVLSGFGSGTGQNVFRTTVSATSWTNISPALDLPCGAIAVDGTTTPTTLYVGTDFGVIRSVDGGASWSVLDDIHFPRVPVFDLVFNAKAGMLRAATYGRGVFQFMKPTGPAIAVNLQDGLDFGTVCSGPNYLTLEVYNVGGADLVITSVQRLVGSSDFTVLSTPATPLTISPGEEVDFTVSFAPTGVGPEAATIRIISNDPTAPFVDLSATGVGGAADVTTAIANWGSFGDVCLGSFVDEALTINNSGTCPLSISDITGSPDFLAPSVAFYPMLVSPGASVDVAIRFQPSSFGPKAGTITIFSNDPAGSHTVLVSGVARAPKANLIIANTGNFGKVCVSSFVDEPLIVTNSGKCTLSVSAIASSSADFLVPQVLSYPITIGPGDALPVPIRFQPTSFGPKSATITLSSDDPASPLSVQVYGDAPSGQLAVAGSTTFGGVTACCCADRTLSICNTGDCGLNVTSVHFKRKSRHWRLLHNPFPAKLHPGSCLPLVIQYRATEKCSRLCELVIECDDPVTPVKIIEVPAYTIWDVCRKEDCDDCRKGCCDEHRREYCCQQGYPCACDDDDDDEDRKEE